MIQFRQKVFAKTNKTLAKAIYVLTGSGNKTGQRFFQPLKPGEKVAQIKKLRERTRKIQAATKKAKHTAMVNPGKPIDDLTKTAIENPAYFVASYHPDLVLIPGTGAAGAVIEQSVLKPYVPGYKAVTEGAGKIYKKSPISKAIRNIPGPQVIASDMEKMANRNYPQNWGK